MPGRREAGHHEAAVEERGGRGASWGSGRHGQGGPHEGACALIQRAQRFCSFNRFPVSSSCVSPRLQVLELLLSQERVISLLYDRALPPRMSFGGFGGIADIVTAGSCMLSLLCSLLTPFPPPLPLCYACSCFSSLLRSADDEQQVRELLEKLPGEGFAETDGWLLEDGDDASP